MEPIAKGDTGCWLWEREMVSFPGAGLTERIIDHEQACRSQFCWRSKDSEARNRNPMDGESVTTKVYL